MAVSYLELSFLTLQATLQTILLCLVGFLAARHGLLTKPVQKALSNLNIKIFTPALIFSKLASKMSLAVMVDVSVIPLFYGLSVLVTLLAATLVARVLRLNRREANFVTAMSVFGNTSSLPVSIVMALAYTLPGLHWDRLEAGDDSRENIASRGILYLVIVQQISLVLRWSWGYNSLLAKPTETELIQEAIQERKEVDFNNSASDLERGLGSSTTISETAPLLSSTKVSVQEWYTDQVSSHQRLLSETTDTDEPAPSPIAQPPMTLRTIASSALRWFLGVMNPPLWSILAALIVALTPSLKHEMFVHKGFVNKTVTAAVQQLATTAVPFILVVLGATLNPDESLANDTEQHKSTKKHTQLVAGSIVSRMLLPPFLILPLTALASKHLAFFFPVLQDPVFLLVAFILTVTPPAVQLSQICSLNKVFEREMAQVLFWGYVVVVLPMIVGAVVLVSRVIEWVR